MTMKRYSLFLLLITLIICLLTACTVSATTDTSTDAIGTTLPEVTDTSSYADDSSSLAKTSDSSETETPNTSTDTPITSSEIPDTTVQTPPTSDPYEKRVLSKLYPGNLACRRTLPFTARFHVGIDRFTGSGTHIIYQSTQGKRAVHQKHRDLIRRRRKLLFDRQCPR